MDTFRARNPLRESGHALIHLAYELTGLMRVKTVNIGPAGKTVGDANHRWRLRWDPRIQAL